MVAVKVGVVPAMTLLFASLRVIVMVEVVVLSAITGPVPEILDVAIAAAPGVNTTVPSDLVTGLVIRRVFVSDLVDENEHTATPPASLIEQAS